MFSNDHNTFFQNTETDCNFTLKIASKRHYKVNAL